MRNTLSCLLTGLIILTTSVCADAQLNGVSDLLWITDPLGNTFASVSQDETTEDARAIIFMTGSAAWLDFSQQNNPTVFYMRGGNPITGPFSDVFGMTTDSSNQLLLAFTSDSDIMSSPYGNVGTLKVAEPIGPYDGTMYLDPSMRASGYHLWFESDFAEVPEPGSITLLLGSGIAGGAIILGRKQMKR